MANPTIAALLAKFPQRLSTTQAGSISSAQAASDVAAGYAFSLFPDPNQYGPYGIVLTQAQVSAANKIPGLESAIPGPWTDDTTDNGGCAAIMGVLPNSPVGDWGPMSASLNANQNFFFSDSGLERFLSTIVTLVPPVSDSWIEKIWHWIESLFGYGPNAVPAATPAVQVSGAVAGWFTRPAPQTSIDSVGSLSAVLDSPVLRRIQTPMNIGGHDVVFEETDWRRLIAGSPARKGLVGAGYNRALKYLEIGRDDAQLNNVARLAQQGEAAAQEVLIGVMHGEVVRMKIGAEKLVKAAISGNANAKAVCREILKAAQQNPGSLKAQTEARLVSDTFQQQRAIAGLR